MCKTNCECEHISHFDHNDHRRMTPNGNHAHSYGREFSDSYIVKLKLNGTPWKVCKDCANDCYHPIRMAEIGVTVEKVD